MVHPIQMMMEEEVAVPVLPEVEAAAVALHLPLEREEARADHRDVFLWIFVRSPCVYMAT